MIEKGNRWQSIRIVDAHDDRVVMATFRMSRPANHAAANRDAEAVAGIYSLHRPADYREPDCGPRRPARVVLL